MQRHTWPVYRPSEAQWWIMLRHDHTAVRAPTVDYFEATAECSGMVGEVKGFLLLDPNWTLENFGKPVSC